jgi:hypothetical protein
MTLSAFEQISSALVLGTALIEIALVAVIFKRKASSNFPAFVAYIVASAVTDLVSAGYVTAFGAQTKFYFWLYWALNAMLMILGFGVLYEIIKAALKPYSGLIDLAKLLFRWAAMFLFIAGTLTALSTIGSASAKCIAAVQLLQRTLLIMQGGLLMLFFLFEQRLSLPWRSYPVSMAFGLGISAAASLSVSFLRVQLAAWSQLIDLADMTVCLLVPAFWVICFALPEPSRAGVLESPNRLIFQRWNEALMSTPMTEEKNPALATVDSFLPGIEKTVDRVLARKIAH